MNRISARRRAILQATVQPENLLPFVQGNTSVNGISIAYDFSNEEYVFNNSNSKASDIVLGTYNTLPIEAGKTYKLTVKKISGDMTLGGGSGITFGIGLFSGSAVMIRTDVSSTEMTSELTAAGQGKTDAPYKLYFQVWRTGTVFDNLRLKITLTEVT